MRDVRTIFVAAAILVAAVLLAGCNADPYETVVRRHEITVTVDVPAETIAGVEQNWTATWIGGQGPYTILWRLSDGISDIGPEPATSPTSVSVSMGDLQMTEPAEYTYTVTVEDALGTSGTATGVYTLRPVPRTVPSIDGIIVNGGEMTVVVSEPGGRDVTVTPSPIDGLSFEPDDVQLAGGNGEAVFQWTAGDFFNGATGTTTVTAQNDLGESAKATADVDLRPGWVGPDTLYALPMVHSATVGEPVTIIVATTETAHPFQFLNGVAIIVEEDAEPVSHSLNYGAIGGAWDDIDGIWQKVGVTSFLTGIPEAGMIFTQAASPANAIPAGRERYDISVPSFGGSDLPFAKGLLFNFQLTFSEPGLKHIGLQQFDGVKRTFYSDGASNEYYWGTLMADEYGVLNVASVDNTILVE